MLQRPLALKHVLLLLVLVVGIGIGGFTYFWNHHDKLGTGGAAASGAGAPGPLTGLAALKVLSSLPQHRGPVMTGVTAAPGTSGGRAPAAPGQPAPQKTAPAVQPVVALTQLPEASVSDNLFRQARLHLSEAVQRAGVKVLLPSEDAADLAESNADPDRAYLNVTVNANRASEGVWVATDLEVTRSAFYLRPRADARLDRGVTAWHLRIGPELYHPADVNAAILSQIDRGMDSFTQVYQGANPVAGSTIPAKSE